MTRPAFIVVWKDRGPGSTVTQATLNSLSAAGRFRHVDLRHLDITDMDREDALRAIKTTASDATALVFAPWRTFGFNALVPACWELMPSLRVVSGTFDNRFEDPSRFGQPLGEVQERGVKVIDTSRTVSPQVAEFGLLMILNLLRGVPDAVAAVRRGAFPAFEAWEETWEYEDGFVAGDLTGRAVGLAGFGAINRRLAELLKPFRCPLTAYDPYLDDETFDSLGVRRAGSLTELAGTSEIFVVGIPPTPVTMGIIDREAIGALHPGSLFVLVTRMAVVEQEALWERTAAGEIRAAVDVYDPEPPSPDAPFRSDPNVIPTPHLAGNTAQAHGRCFQVACEEALKVLAGERSAFEMTSRDTAIYAGRQP